MPFSSQQVFDVAVVQAASTFLNREASIQKVAGLATEAAVNGAKLVLFPEAFIPGYPRGLSFGATVGSRSAEGRALFRRCADAAITGPGPDTIRLGGLPPIWRSISRSAWSRKMQRSQAPSTAASPSRVRTARSSICTARSSQPPASA